MTATRIGVVGHVEHVTLGRVEVAPRAGEIAHLGEPRVIPAGGGGIAFSQLVHSDAEVHLFTAVGDDDGGRLVRGRLATREGVHIHAATRARPHPRVVVMVDANGKRTIVVTDKPLHAEAKDPLPWELLASCDAVFFTGADPMTLTLARAARSLVVTARRHHVLLAAAVRADVVVGSVADPRERAARNEYAPPPDALVLTDGMRPIRITREDATVTVDAPERVTNPTGDYGAGDSFAAALTYFVARGQNVEDAARRAGPYGAAVLRGINPLETQATLAL